MVFQIAICDDNRRDLDQLCLKTKRWIENSEITGSVYSFQNPEELQECCQKKSIIFDLYVLDIRMASMDGLQLGRLIRSYDADVPIIYITMMTEHALDAYGIHAIRYLVKPLKMEELHSALDLAYALFRMRPRHTLLIRGPEFVTSIVVEEIMYIENNLRSITYTMNDNSTVESVRRSGSFESAVGQISSDKYFIQPHKSFFANIRYIHALQSDEILMDDGRRIPIARSRLADIQNQYISFISGERSGDL